MSQTTRAERRAFSERAKLRVRRYFSVAWSKGDKRVQGIIARTRCRCSCHLGCGNPRHYSKDGERLTMAERRQNEREATDD